MSCYGPARSAHYIVALACHAHVTNDVFEEMGFQKSFKLFLTLLFVFHEPTLSFQLSKKNAGVNL